MKTGGFKMLSSWILALVFLMAGTGDTGRRKSQASKRDRPGEESEGSDYAPGADEADSSDEDTMASPPTVAYSRKGKEPAGASSKGKGKEKIAPRRSKRTATGIHIDEQASEQPQAEPEPPVVDRKKRHRQAVFAKKMCIGERHVDVSKLIDEAPAFRRLFENGNLSSICHFSEQTGFCVELIRDFYMNAGYLNEGEDGYDFSTRVRGVDLLITPDTIGQVLGMDADTSGVLYFRSSLTQYDDWREVVQGVCVPNATGSGNTVQSTELKMEYRFLNFIVGYNILPTMNTKLIRWERLLYMYLLGNPAIVDADQINVNVPFLIWNRMARELKTSHQAERLPYPMLIMRILKLHNVSTSCPSYEHSLGTINASTIMRSRSQGLGRASQDIGQSSSPPRQSTSQPRHSSSLPPRRSGSQRQRPSVSQPPPTRSDEDDVSVTSIYHEQQRLSSELERISTEQVRMNKKLSKLQRIMKAIFNKLGCGSADLPQDDDDSD